MKGTKPITYHYDIDGHDVAITRHHVKTAYPMNGNVGNPTEYFVWSVKVDDVSIATNLVNRADGYEEARCSIAGIVYRNDEYRHRYENVRSFYLVQQEMKANYRSQERHA